MTLSKSINQAKSDYEEILEHHIQKGVGAFDALLLKDKKEVVWAYLKTLRWDDREEVVGEAYAQIASKATKLMISMMENPNEQLDYSSELMSRWIVAIMDQASTPIEEDIERLEALFEAYDLENAELDRCNRRFDMETMKIADVHKETIRKIMGFE